MLKCVVPSELFQHQICTISSRGREAHVTYTADTGLNSWYEERVITGYIAVRGPTFWNHEKYNMRVSWADPLQDNFKTLETELNILHKTVLRKSFHDVIPDVTVWQRVLHGRFNPNPGWELLLSAEEYFNHCYRRSTTFKVRSQSTDSLLPLSCEDGQYQGWNGAHVHHCPQCYLHQCKLFSVTIERSSCDNQQAQCAFYEFFR